MKKELFSQNRRDFFSKIFIAGTGSLALLSLTGCGGSDGSNVPNVPVVSLTADQKYLLLWMYQEEKVARDVYIWMNDIYGTQTDTFANIQESEQSHMDAVEKLCIKYGVDISEVDENDIGVFILTDLQDLYNAMIARDGSLEEALQVGIDIETTDITDLDNAIAAMPSDASDIIRVFENIQEGSFNHLGAFTYALSQLTP